MSGYLLPVLLGTAPLWLAGCGGADAGTDIRMAEPDRPDLDKQQSDEGHLVIPTDVPFNYPRFRRGAEGVTARGDAQPIGANGAKCRAEVSGEGSAWGAFQLGYGFDNMTADAMAAVVKLALQTRQSTGSLTDGTARGTATGTLSFFIKDAYTGEVLRKEVLASIDLSKGSTSSTASPEYVFDLRLKPQRGYYLVLSGRAEVRADSGESAQVSLAAEGVVVDLTWRRAPSATEPDRRSAAADDPSEEPAAVGP